MPSRPNEHSSLGAPVRGCYHLLKCDRQNNRPQWPSATQIEQICNPDPPWLRQHATVRERATCIPRLTLTGAYGEVLVHAVRVIRVCGGGARSSGVETATRGRSPS